MSAGLRFALVTPSNRLDSLGLFLAAWKPFPWQDTIVVYDGHLAADGKVDLRSQGVDLTLDWSDTPCSPGLDMPLFSRRDSACRNHGFLEAVRRGADVVVTLDDDCLPGPDGPAAFLQGHRRNLYVPLAWTSTVPGLRVRGLPYGPAMSEQFVALSMGLWRGNPDQDAICQLHEPLVDFVPPPGTRLMNPNQLFPLCGMNLAFRRELLPAMYFPLMGEGSHYARFDDIWCGLVAETICAARGWGMVVGEPHVQHTRASNPFRNLVKEAPGVVVHEQLWRLFGGQQARASMAEGVSVADNVLGLAMYLRREAATSPDPSYVTGWGLRLKAWVRLAKAALSGESLPKTESGTAPDAGS